MDLLSAQQEILSKYKKRFERYRDSMFTFLNGDEIPWNSNAAEPPHGRSQVAKSTPRPKNDKLA
jgi:hypothetical protein